MNSKKIDLTQLGGFGFTQDGLDFIQAGSHHGFTALARAMGDKVIMTGVEDQGATVSDGYLLINGELLPFVGGAKLPKVWIETVTDVELFGDSSLKTVYSTRRARMGNIGDYNLSDFRKWKTDSLTLDDSEVVASAKAVKKLQDTIIAMLGFESTIVLNGCATSNINAGASTLDISAGVVMISGAIVAAQAYSGQYPAYLKPDGTWTTVAPAGQYIAFNPHTSQRYADVLRRATTPVGEIKTFKTLSDRFDGNGVGRWEMLGFKLSDDMQSRVPVGYDRRQVDPLDNVWDQQHTEPGTPGGEKRHQLTLGEMPRHRFSITIPSKNFSTQTNSGVNLTGPGDSALSNQTLFTEYLGNDQAHENRQPFRVVVFAERI